MRLQQKIKKSTRNAETLGSLAQRARERRRWLGVPLSALSTLLQVTDPTIRKWEAGLPPVSEKDAKWEAALLVPPGWLRSLHMATPALPPTGLEGEAVTAAEEIREICRWLSRAWLPGRTGQATALSAAEIRRAEILALRYGLAGEAESTTQKIADRYGVSCTRIGQITRNLSKRVEGVQIKTPRCDALKTSFVGELPRSVAELDHLFAAQLGESLSIAGVVRFMQDLIRNPEWHFSPEDFRTPMPWLELFFRD